LYSISNITGKYCPTAFILKVTLENFITTDAKTRANLYGRTNDTTRKYTVQTQKLEPPSTEQQAAPQEKKLFNTFF